MLNARLGPTATRVHLLTVIAVAVVGVGLLVLIGVEMAFGGDSYSRDMAVLGLVITTPIWVAGVVAAVEAISVLRGRPVTRRRGLIVALAIVIAGIFLVVSSGQLALATSLLTRPDLVAFDWPAIALITADRSGASYFYIDQPGFWLPIAAIALGVVSTIVVAVDRHRDQVAPRQAAKATHAEQSFAPSGREQTPDELI